MSVSPSEKSAGSPLKQNQVSTRNFPRHGEPSRFWAKTLLPASGSVGTFRAYVPLSDPAVPTSQDVSELSIGTARGPNGSLRSTRIPGSCRAFSTACITESTGWYRPG